MQILVWDLNQCLDLISDFDAVLLSSVNRNALEQQKQLSEVEYIHLLVNLIPFILTQQFQHAP